MYYAGLFQEAREREEQDGFIRGFYDIPDDGVLREMSLMELVELSSQSEKGGPKQRIIELEIARRSSASFWRHPILRIVFAALNMVARYLGKPF